MPKNTSIQTHWADVPSAVEIARLNVVTKRETSIGGQGNAKRLLR